MKPAPLAQDTPSRPQASPSPASTSRPRPQEPPSTDLMILPDGTLYARNLTPELAAVLALLNPSDPTMSRRAKPTR